MITEPLAHSQRLRTRPGHRGAGLNNLISAVMLDALVRLSYRSQEDLAARPLQHHCGLQCEWCNWGSPLDTPLQLGPDSGQLSGPDIPCSEGGGVSRRGGERKRMGERGEGG